MPATLRAGAVLSIALLSACSGPATQGILATPARITKSISGDGTNTKGIAQTLASAYSADPLGLKYAELTFPEVGSKGKDFIGAAVSDSLAKCQNFVSAISAGQAIDNTFWDVLSITLSGLASVFVPVSTVRALAAASTLSQGTKTAINSNFFQQMTIVIFTQKIETSYYSDISKFIDDDSQWGSNAGGSFAKLQNIHRKCSITYAASSLTSQAAQPPITSVLSPSLIYDGSKVSDGQGSIYLIKAVSAGFTFVQIDKDGKTLGVPSTIMSRSQLRVELQGLGATQRYSPSS